MNKILTVAWHEFLTNVRKRSFLFALIGVPLFSIGLLALVILVQINVAEGGTTVVEEVGYVDLSGVLEAQIEQPENFIVYTSEDAASAALENDEVDAYFVVQRLYLRTGQVALYADGTVPDDVQEAIEDYLRANLVAGIADETQLPPERLRNPVNMDVFVESTEREISREGFVGLLMLPLVFSLIFMFGLQFSGQYLMSGVVEEKANRIMEVLVTSLSPMQLLAGKLIGLGGLGLLQIGVWLVAGMAIVFVGQSQDVAFLSAITLPLDLLLVTLVLFVLTYFLYASLMAGVGVVTGAEQESRQIAGLFIFPIVLPFFFVAQFIQDPNGTIPTLLSIIPFTAGIGMLMRLTFTSVPLDQIVLAMGLLLGTTVVITWAAARIFHWALLLYGKKPGPRAILRALTNRVEIGSTAPLSKES